jgi:hypothetical protein
MIVLPGPGARALVDGLLADAHAVIGMRATSACRTCPSASNAKRRNDRGRAGSARRGRRTHCACSAAVLDAVIYNLGVWEEKAFSDDYAFLGDGDETVVDMVNTNITATILLLKRLRPACWPAASRS